MEMETSEDYSASNGQCSSSKEDSRMLVDMSSPNVLPLPQGPNSPNEVAIKQEEDLVEDGDNSSPAPEEIGHTGNEGATPDESITSSPHDVQDGLSGPNVPSDAGVRQQNGMYYFDTV
ncbi:hypothetical protein CHARACLAT_020075 [Characodon lateralis]|uniref:Uncharacterized protein n=1 Tax=Characodon lateralis TaxID=208331 RepID=A0ABU7EVF7_9TELE|nr:hypothetical protein [Characodon lateralis]